MTRDEDIKNAVAVLKRGGVILYPTDTVWGIGCDATNAEAVKRVYEIKQRDDSKALICLVDSDARMQRYVRQVPDVAWQLIDSLKDGDGKPSPRSFVTVFRRHWSLLRRISVVSLLPRTIAILTLVSLRL